jgi:putative ABC transport system permease protein
VLVNQALVQAYGWDDPIGQPLDGFSLDAEGETTPTVVGVVKDYHFQSLHTAIEPMVLFLKPRDDPFRYLFARVRGDDLPGALAALEAAWQRTAPERPFTYYFLDDDLDRLYQTETQWQQVTTFAALFALLIACLGLFGLAAFTAERRTKEIGIRKTLGASVSGLAVFLSKDFLKLVLVANLLAWPAAYVLFQQWLERFAYHIEISWGIFLMAGLAAIGIALVTVSYQTIRAALADPVKSLRYE